MSIEKDIYSKKVDIVNFKMGQLKSYHYYGDVKRLGFDASKYKFCSRILEDKSNILEIGCGDALWTPIIAKGKNKLVAIDKEEYLINDNKKRMLMFDNIHFIHKNILDGVNDKFDGIISLDVLEHIDKKDEDIFFNNIINSLSINGICIIGIPNKTAEKYASEISKEHHINLKTYDELKLLMKKYFPNVLMFGKNDEVIHTGYPNMCHYLIGVGIL